MFKWQIPVLMLSCRFRKFISQIVGKIFKVNAWVGFVKNEICFRSFRNTTNKQKWQREIQVCESFLSICESLSMLALSVNPKCFRSEFQLEWNSVLFVSEVVRWNQTLWCAIAIAPIMCCWVNVLREKISRQILSISLW